MQDERFTKSAGTIPQRLASLKACSITELKEQWRALYKLRAAASHQPRTADPCRGIPNSGTSPSEGSNPPPDDCSFVSPTTRDRDGRLDLSRPRQRQRGQY